MQGDHGLLQQLTPPHVSCNDDSVTIIYVSGTLVIAKSNVDDPTFPFIIETNFTLSYKYVINRYIQGLSGKFVDTRCFHL